jgi:hypothetical protein
MKAKLLWWVAVIASLVGCKEDPKPGTPVTFETVCDEKFDSTMEQGLSVTKRVTLEGYLGAPRMMFCSDTCNLDLHPTAARDGRSISIAIKIGGDENQMDELPKDFSDSDVKVHTKDGKVIGVGGKLRVTGGRLGTKKEKACQITGVDLIESA